MDVSLSSQKRRRGEKRVWRFRLLKVSRWWGQKRDGEGTAPPTRFFFSREKESGRKRRCASVQLKGLKKKIESAQVCGYGIVAVVVKGKV
jgi:hypothetical protein